MFGWFSERKRKQNLLRAVDVRALKPEHISWEAVGDGVSPSILPTRLVTSDAPSGAALSWRWDLDLFEGRSRNVALALKYAAEQGVSHVFLDMVTVDQNLQGKALIEDVAALAGLYKQLPVIIAADREDVDDEHWALTFRRPWLLYEARAYAQSSQDATYVGFLAELTRERRCFKSQVEVIGRAGFAMYVFYVLYGYVGMATPHDFAYILRPFYSLFSFLHEEMTPEDYLFSVFLICAMHEPTQAGETRGESVDLGFRIHFHDLQIEKWALKRYKLGPIEPSRFYETTRTISLDGTPVAIWRNKMTSSFNRNWIKVLPDVDQTIFDAVNAPAAVRKDYKDTKGERTAWLFIRAAKSKRIHQKTADLARFSWRPAA